MEGDVITMQDIFIFERQGIGEDDKVLGQFKATGIRPKFADRLKAYGIDLGALLFLERWATAAPAPPAEGTDGRPARHDVGRRRRWSFSRSPSARSRSALLLEVFAGAAGGSARR